MQLILRQYAAGLTSNHLRLKLNSHQDSQTALQDKSNEKFFDDLLKMAAKTKPLPPHTAVMVNEPGGSIELLLDTRSDYYSEWIPGEGADICLFRDMETHKVVGCDLPLYHKELRISYWRNTMGKSVLKSKTMWANMLVLAAGVATYLQGHELIAENPAIVSGITVAIAVINMGLRFVTVEPIK